MAIHAHLSKAGMHACIQTKAQMAKAECACSPYLIPASPRSQREMWVIEGQDTTYVYIHLCMQVEWRLSWC